MQVDIIVQQILVLIILVVIGIIATKRNIIQREFKTILTSIIFNITLPFLIITQISSLDINKEILISWGLIILFSTLAILLYLYIGYLTKRMLKLTPKQIPVHILHSAFGNTVFLGFPILDALFPEEGLLYGIIFFLTHNTLTWTLGIFILTKEEKQGKIQNLKNLLNPNTISFFIGFGMLLTHIHIPDFMFGSLQGLGKTTLYLAMLYIGSILADVNLKSIVNNRNTFVVSLNKLIVGPFILILLMHLLLFYTSLDLPAVARSVTVLESAMPCGTVMVILARQYHKDDFYATQNISVSTLLSIFTLPFIFFISQLIL